VIQPAWKTASALTAAISKLRTLACGGLSH
jgi:hypothetical protein